MFMLSNGDIIWGRVISATDSVIELETELSKKPVFISRNLIKFQRECEILKETEVLNLKTSVIRR